MNFDAGNVLGMFAIFGLKFLVLDRYATKREEWQKWVIAGAVGLAVNVTTRLYVG